MWTYITKFSSTAFLFLHDIRRLGNFSDYGKVATLVVLGFMTSRLDLVIG